MTAVKKIVVPRPDGDISVEVSGTFGGRGTDLVALARHWYYLFLLIMWAGFVDEVAKVIAWLVRIA